MSSLTRRDLLKMGLTTGSLASLYQGGLSGCSNSGRRQTRQKMIILGFDGLDPDILESLMNQGKLPAFRKLSSDGCFHRLRTSLPPQSPVAWSNFITGMDPGGHGIFDFIHRTPENYLPYLSTSQVTAAKRKIDLGGYVLPISSGKIELLRKGRAFWQILEDHGVPSTIVQIPANFPPAETSQRTLSGMGTPDILGTYGTYNLYTTQHLEIDADIGGGKANLVQVTDHIVEAELEGPKNEFRKEGGASAIRFRVFVDPVHPVAKVQIQDHEFILKEGDWSEWKRISFQMIPMISVSGICQFYLSQVHPEFKLYVSPIHIDPADPALPISTPADYSGELETRFGPYFTKGLPADTKALSHGALDEEAFLTQDGTFLEESRALFEYELQRFESGLWFHYFSSADQRQHMFLRYMDKDDPFYDSLLAAKYGSEIERVYSEMDDILARAMTKVDRDTLLMVMSDHGFAPFRRCFNLNTWLLRNGYMRIFNPSQQESAELFSNTNWEGTRAYALGINGLYINVRGREGMGIVRPGSEKQELIRKMVAKLENVVDPINGEKVITKAYIASEAYHGPMVDQAPDIIIGYNRGYRASWGTPLGKTPKDILVNNEDKWGADHCMDPQLLPGILLMNRPSRIETPALYDLTATILDFFSIEKPPEMIGNNIL